MTRLQEQLDAEYTSLRHLRLRSLLDEMIWNLAYAQRAIARELVRHIERTWSKSKTPAP